MANEQVKLLAETYEMSHGLVRFYTSALKTADPYQQWEVNGKKLNSIAWITAHLCWVENWLLLKALDGPAIAIDWADHYKLGSDGTLHEPAVDFKTILQHRKTVHEAAMLHINSLSDADLTKENPAGVKLWGDGSYKMMIQHAIRHEASHAGHLGWLCKINGIQTI